MFEAHVIISAICPLLSQSRMCVLSCGKFWKGGPGKLEQNCCLYRRNTSLMQIFALLGAFSLAARSPKYAPRGRERRGRLLAASALWCRVVAIPSYLGKNLLCLIKVC